MIAVLPAGTMGLRVESNPVAEPSKPDLTVAHDGVATVSMYASALRRMIVAFVNCVDCSIRAADTGLYAQALWRFAQRWSTAARYDFATGVANDYLDPEWTRARHRGSADLTFYPTEFSRLRLQGSVDRPLWLHSPIWASFLALEVAIGAHGAHQF